MNDRELLELAAKAAGVDSSNMNDDGVWINAYRTWNPLTLDGDALQLAVYLSFDIAIGAVIQIAWEIDDSIEWVEESIDGDRRAQVRRAIVRAAAEIGRAMP